MFRKASNRKFQITRSLKPICIALCLLALAVCPASAASAGGERDRYGGWTKLRFEATGFFHASARDGIWWLVSPEGNTFISKGVNHVNFLADDAPKLGYSPYLRGPEQVRLRGRLGPGRGRPPSGLGLQYARGMDQAEYLQPEHGLHD